MILLGFEVRGHSFNPLAPVPVVTDHDVCMVSCCAVVRRLELV